MEQTNQVILQTTGDAIARYKNPQPTLSAGAFPQFVKQNYQMCKGSTHGQTMKNLSNMYHDTKNN